MELQVKQLRKNFEELEVLKGVSFNVSGGKALGLLGRNGAGKTTTIRIIMDVFKAKSGEILLDGSKFETKKNMVGYLPEERGMYPKKIVLEQMVYLGMLKGLNKKEAVVSSKKWLERLGISEYEKRKLDTLSKGNQQKVQLAATLVGDPDIVILDEPFSGLDPVNSQILKDVVNEIIELGKIVIFSSHQMSYVEEFCDDIVIIDKGEVVLSGQLKDVKKEYGQKRKILSALNCSLEELEKICTERLSTVVEIDKVKKDVLVLRLIAKQWEFLEELRKNDIEIEKFGIYEPSLNDIFVDKVGEVVISDKKEEEQEIKKSKSKKISLSKKR